MTEQIASDIWREIKRYIGEPDRIDAATTIIDVLINNDCDPEIIKDAFGNDSIMKKALSAYLDRYESEEYDESEDLEEYEDDEQEDDEWS